VRRPQDTPKGCDRRVQPNARADEHARVNRPNLCKQPRQHIRREFAEGKECTHHGIMIARNKDAGNRRD
jgi:hypothetical protein